MLTAQWRALGTSVLVAVPDRCALARARAAVAREVDALDSACSRFRVDSDLSMLNAAAGHPVVVSPLLAEAIRAALRGARLTEGDVDPTVGISMMALGYDRDFHAVRRNGPGLTEPFRAAPGWQTVQIAGDPAVVTAAAGTLLDLGATAKALGADRAAAAAHDAAGCAVLVNLGGDISAAGGAPSGGWAVRVADDHDAPPDAPGQEIAFSGGGLATSSSTVRRWRRGGVALHHLVDPRTGAPAASPYRTVSAAAATCLDANIATTAALVRGLGGAEWLQATGLPARLVTLDGRVEHLNGWPTTAERAA